MVHLRLNEREANPNPFINFITALPTPDDPSSHENARELLRALAAQVKPVMKDHGFTVNSFEEYEYNDVFAGRNWESGDVVELVLRRGNGSFQSTSWLMSTLCHELAHVKYMDHSPPFQALWAQLRREVRELQDKGYYGDGYWSSGTRLTDSAVVGGSGIDTGDFPEYICGGAQKRARPTSRRRRRQATSTAGPSNHTGAQTSKRRKAGGRVTANKFTGEGVALNDGVGSEGTGFRKKAGSKRAREERALAAERRLRGQAPFSLEPRDQKETQEESEDDEEIIHETNQERRRAMPDTGSELDDLKASRHDFSKDFIFPSSQPRKTKQDNGLGLGKMVQTEIQFRKREALGLTGEGKKLGSASGLHLE